MWECTLKRLLNHYVKGFAGYIVIVIGAKDCKASIGVIPNKYFVVKGTGRSWCTTNLQLAALSPVTNVSIGIFC